jgi:hypothetical protein
MTRRCASATLSFALLLGAGIGGRAEADVPAEGCSGDRLASVLAQVAKARAGVSTLSGPFTQERTIGLLAAKVRSTGTLTLVRPDRLRWELAPPDSIVYWVTPEGLAYRSPSAQGKAPAANRKVADALADLRVLLGGDLASLEARYELTATCPVDAPVTFRALPRPGTTSSFQELRFTLAPDLVAPTSVTIIEGPRDRTEIRFGALQANGHVDSRSMAPPTE